MSHDLRTALVNRLLAALTVGEEEVNASLMRAEYIGKVLSGCEQVQVRGTQLSGSLMKGTAISPLRDIDVLVLLNPHNPYTDPNRIQPATLIGRIRDRIAQTQTRSLTAGTRDVYAQDHSICLNMKGQGPNIDFIPAFLVQGDYLTIAEKSSKKYVRTSVVRQNATLQIASLRAPGLRGGIRLLKAWRRAAPRRVLLGSYAIELLALHAAASGATTALEVLDSTLELIARTRLRFTLTETQLRKPRSRLCSISDLAVPDNNVVAHLDRAALDRTADYAAKTWGLWRAAQTQKAAARALLEGDTKGVLG